MTSVGAFHLEAGCLPAEHAAFEEADFDALPDELGYELLRLVARAAIEDGRQAEHEERGEATFAFVRGQVLGTRDVRPAERGRVARVDEGDAAGLDELEDFLGLERAFSAREVDRSTSATIVTSVSSGSASRRLSSPRFT